MSRLLHTLRGLDNAQEEFALLRCCVGEQMLGYALRTMPPKAIRSEIAAASAALQEAVSSVARHGLSEDAVAQASLPIKMGGLGVRVPSDTAEASFVASVVGTEQLCNGMLGREAGGAMCRSGFVEALALLPGSAAASTPDPAGARSETDLVAESQAELSPWSAERLLQERPTQAQLTRPVYVRKFARLLARSSYIHRARLRSVARVHAGAFLEAVPIGQLKMMSTHFAVALQLRLGAPVYAVGMPPLCPKCHKSSDRRGHHAMSCATTSDRIIKHDTVCDIVAGKGKEAGLHTQREVRNIVPDSRARPGDVVMYNWEGGRTVALDITVVSPVAETVVREAADEGGAAAAAAELLKDDKALEACAQQDIDFLPLALESFGGWGKLALTFFRKLGRLIAQRSGRPESLETRYMFQSMSVALQRGNAIMIQERAPEFVRIAED